MCDRAKTMSVKALRRLSETELAGLRLALDVVAQTEMTLVQAVDRMRRAAVKEYSIRSKMGLTGPGEFARAHQAVLEVVKVLTVAREETTTTVTTGKVKRE